MSIKTAHMITAAGIAVGLLSINSGCGENNSSDMAKRYNVLFVVMDQEHFFANYPQSSNYRASNGARSCVRFSANV